MPLLTSLASSKRWLGRLAHRCSNSVAHWAPNWLLRPFDHAGRERTEAIVSAIPEPSFAIDLTGKITFWNQAMEDLSGLKAKDMVGKGDYAYALAFYGIRRPILIDCIGLPMEVVQAHYPKVRREGETLIAEAETTHLKGRLHGIVSAVATPLYDARGKRIGAIEQVRDETELRHAFTKITNLSLAVEQSPNGTVITNRHAAIEYVNEAFLDMYGYTREELIGKQIGMLSSGETPKRTIEAMWTALNQERTWKGEFINRRKNGEQRMIFVRISPIRQLDGTIRSYLAIQEDMTERKRIGQELDRHRHHLQTLVTERTAELEALKEAAESANEAKSAFLANMSHEIRTPMNGIIGLTRIVMQKTTSPEHRRQLGKVLETAQILLSMINDILDISKIEAHKLAIEESDFYLSPLLDRQIDLIRHQAESKGLKIYTDLSATLSMPLKGDSLRIGQILLNFLGNAVKFTEQGSVTVQARLVDTLATESGQTEFLIRFNIIDTGIGIPSSVAPRLFQSFEQGDVTITRKFGGTGLGLAISRRLAEMMRGEVGVDSEEGKGSCFWFTIRVGKGNAENIHNTTEIHLIASEDTTPNDNPYEQAQALGAQYPQLKILLAEDNEINQEVALSLFHGTGFLIDVAENGAQAVKKARAESYDLILMDIQMPVMDGLTATRQIRRLSWHEHTPIIAMTANAFEEDREDCMNAGMDAHLSKPVSPATLYAVIHTVLSRKTAKSQSVLPATEEGLATQPNSVETEEPVSTNTGTAIDDPLLPLQKISGLDIETGLASLGGRVKPYLRMLRKFALAQKGDSAALLSALQNIHTPPGRDEARRLAHSLKGVAGTLGMPKLKDKSAELEVALKNNAAENEILRLGSELVPIREQLTAILLEHLPETDR